jgi:hypothetical protein
MSYGLGESYIVFSEGFQSKQIGFSTVSDLNVQLTKTRFIFLFGFFQTFSGLLYT